MSSITLGSGCVPSCGHRDRERARTLSVHARLVGQLGLSSKG